jgi:hypothetical protein
MATYIQKKLGNKNTNIMQFVVCSSLIFFPPMHNEIKPFILVLLKASILYFGVGCGVGLQLAFSEMSSKKEKRMHLALVTTLAILVAVILNFKNI